MVVIGRWLLLIGYVYIKKHSRKSKRGCYREVAVVERLCIFESILGKQKVAVIGR